MTVGARVPWVLVLALLGCADASAPDPRCARAQRQFDDSYSVTAAALGFKRVPAGEVPVEVASGVAVGAVQYLPEQAGRAACYGEVMRSHGYRFFPSLVEIEAAYGQDLLDARRRKSSPAGQ